MENQAHIDIYIIIGALAMLCLMVALFAIFKLYESKVLEKEARLQFIENEKKIELFKGASEAEEKERVKIAQNLHDGVIPTISTVKRSLDKNIKDYGTNSFDIERLKKDLQYVEQAIEDLRGISHDLVPKTLLTLGLFKALEENINQLSGIDGAETVFEDNTKDLKEVPFTIPEQLNIYRICQELLTNLGKHAGYMFLKVSAEQENGNLVIAFSHNGIGVTDDDIETLSKSSSGLGLSSMKSRVMILKAKLNYSISDDIAFILLTIPIRG